MKEGILNSGAPSKVKTHMKMSMEFRVWIGDMSKRKNCDPWKSC